VVLERGERLLEAHLQVRDDRLVEAVVSRLRLSSVATATAMQPAVAEPRDTLARSGKPGAPLAYQQSDSVRPPSTASVAGAQDVRRRRRLEGGPQVQGSVGEAAGPGQIALLQRSLMPVIIAGSGGVGADGRGDMGPREEAGQPSVSPMPPRRRRPLGQLRVAAATVAAVAGRPAVAGGSAEPR
jgi:hypothetical protein